MDFFKIIKKLKYFIGIILIFLILVFFILIVVCIMFSIYNVLENIQKNDIYCGKAIICIILFLCFVGYGIFKCIIRWYLRTQENRLQVFMKTLFEYEKKIIAEARKELESKKKELNEFNKSNKNKK